MCNNYRKVFFEDSRGNHGWYECVACGKKMHFKDCTVDHIVPQSYHGWHSPDNLQAMCRSCNSSKNNSLKNVIPDYLRNNAERTAQKVHRQINHRGLNSIPTASAIGAAAKAGGVTGALVSAGLETVSSLYDVITGEKDVSDMVCDVAYEGAKGGTAGYIGTAAGVTAAGATSAAITASGITSLAAGGVIATAGPILLGLGTTLFVGNLVCDAFDSIFD